MEITPYNTVSSERFLWLGHEDMQTTQVYLRADPTEKLEAIKDVVPPTLKRGHFEAPDKLIASLQGTGLC